MPAGSITIADRGGSVKIGGGSQVIKLGARAVLKIGTSRQGEAGPRGLDGVAGGTASHAQSVASNSWTVNHNLGFYPSANVLTSGRAEVVAEVSHISINQLIVSFKSPSTGFVELS